MSKLPKQMEDQLIAENPGLRSEGLRPAVFWFHDTESPEFRHALKQQIKAIRGSPEEREVLEFVEEIADWPKD